MTAHTTIAVTFEPGGRCVRVAEGSSVLFAAWQAGIAIKSVCGGRGKCGTCLIQVDKTPDGALSKVSKAESDLLPRSADGRKFRLACMTQVYGDASVHIPSESEAAEAPPRKPYTVSHVASAPTVTRVTVQIEGPYAEPVRPLAIRISEALAGERTKKSKKKPMAIRPAVLGDYARRRGFDTATRVTATLHEREGVIQLRPEARSALFGAAVDIGTTSIVVFLCDLTTSEIRAVRTASNPQAAYGEDVISRMTHIHRDPAMLGKLQLLLVAEINRMIEDAARSAGVERDDIFDTVVVGNPTMQHILLGVNPEPIGRGPYMSLWSEGVDEEAADVGLQIAPGGRLYVFPMASGYIGGDTISAVLTRGREFYRGAHLLVDIGTNGEVVLAKDGVLTATSCATGPVYEGAHIRCGMRAAPGAIERVWVDTDGALQWSTIPHPDQRDVQPLGICGSGVISGVAALVAAEILHTDGGFDREHPAVRVDPETKAAELVLVDASRTQTQRDIVITQSDVRNVQLGKAALRAGIEILLRAQKVKRLDRIYLAGAFGNHLDPADILAIGLIPPIAVNQVQTIGNAAGDGARLALFNRTQRRRAERLADNLEVIELSNRREFQDTFIECTELSPQPVIAALADVD
jgi:uncharacterized 2Fe-2S/4Fe-4S cluster protein (DUF4445 family)